MGFMFHDFVLVSMGYEQLSHQRELQKERVQFEKELKKLRDVRNF